MPFTTVSTPKGPVARWVPTPKQKEFIELSDEIDEAFYGGAVGSGKSEVLIMLPAIREFYKNTNFQGIIFRRKLTQLKRSLIPRAKAFYKHFGLVYNEQDKCFQSKNTGRIFFGHIEHEGDEEQYDTDEYQYAGFDELTHFTKNQYGHIAFSRVRSINDPTLPAIVRAGSNPENIGHIWVRERFVDPNPDGYTLIRDLDTETTRFFLPSTIRDNPHTLKNDPKYLKRLGNLPLHKRRAKIDGDWYAVAGQAFPDFRDRRFEDEPDNALHVVEPFEIPIWWPRIAAIDWGYDKPTVIYWAAIDPVKHRLIIYREYQCKETLVSVWATHFAYLSRNESISAVSLDPSAWQNRGMGIIAQKFYEHSGYVPLKANNDRVGGKLLVHEFLRWSKLPPSDFFKAEFSTEDIANYIDMFLGRDVKEDYLIDYNRMQETEDNLPKLLIFNKSPENIPIRHLQKSIKNCIDGERNPEDVEEFDGDDPYDALRYLLFLATQYINQEVEMPLDLEILEFAKRPRNTEEEQTDFAIKMAQIRQEQNDSLSNFSVAANDKYKPNRDRSDFSWIRPMEKELGRRQRIPDIIRKLQGTGTRRRRRIR